MGRRGPKPEPAAVKAAKGNPGRRPIGADPEPQGGEVRSKVKPPSWLKPKRGLEIWNRIAPLVAQRKLLTQLDAETFARYCINFQRWLDMQAKLNKDGAVYWTESAHGKLRRAHPAFLIGDRLERTLTAAEANFGLNPAERQRIYAARAAVAGSGDLFDRTDPPPGAATSPPAGEQPEEKPAVGFLN